MFFFFFFISAQQAPAIWVVEVETEADCADKVP